jgi:hypothetical protein
MTDHFLEHVRTVKPDPTKAERAIQVIVQITRKHFTG